MYHTFRLNIKKGEEISYLQYLTGVHKGDPLTPLLFVLVYQVCMETLDIVGGGNFLPLLFCYFHDAVNGSPCGYLTNQGPAAETPFAFLKPIYVDNEALLTATQQEAVNGVSLLKRHLLCFGLMMHTGLKKNCLKWR
jgi:hypothetical protein